MTDIPKITKTKKTKAVKNTIESTTNEIVDIKAVSEPVSEMSTTEEFVQVEEKSIESEISIEEKSIESETHDIIDPVIKTDAAVVKSKSYKQSFEEKIANVKGYELFFRDKKIYDSLIATTHPIPKDDVLTLGNIHYPYSGIVIKTK